MKPPFDEPPYDPRFDADRIARAEHRADYDNFRAEVNDLVDPGREPLRPTRGPDAIGEDVRAVLGFLVLVVAVIALIGWAVFG